MAEGFVNQLQAYVGVAFEVIVNGQNIGRITNAKNIDVHGDTVTGTRGSAKISTIQTLTAEMPKS